MVNRFATGFLVFIVKILLNVSLCIFSGNVFGKKLIWAPEVPNLKLFFLKNWDLWRQVCPDFLDFNFKFQNRTAS